MKGGDIMKKPKSIWGTVAREIGVELPKEAYRQVTGRRPKKTNKGGRAIHIHYHINNRRKK